MRIVSQHLYIVYTSILFLFTLNMFLNSSLLAYIIGLLAIPMFIVSFPSATRLFRTLGIVFVILGTCLFIYSGTEITQLPLFMTSTMPLLAFLTVLPWMNSVVRAGRFDRRINELMKSNVKDVGKLYGKSSFTTYILSMFINLSALTLSQEVLSKNLRKMSKQLQDSFISQTTLRAFALAMAWSPMEVLVAMTVDTTGVSYLTYLPWLFLCSFIVFLLDSLWGRRHYRQFPYEATSTQVRTLSIATIITKIAKLILVLSLFLALIVTIGNVFHLNFILSVTLVILPFSFTWALLMKRMRSFLSIGIKTWKTRTNSLQNLVVLFLSLAFFSTSLNATPFLQLIQEPFVLAGERPLLLLLLIQLTYLLMAMIGVHPIATIGVLMEVVQPIYALVNPLSIGIVFITGALATATVGAYGVTVTLTAMNTQQNPYRITMRNMPFALFYGLVGTLIAYLLL